MKDPRRSAPDGTRDGRPRAGRSRRWLALLGLVWLGTATDFGAELSVSREYQIKAAFLYNFTKFVEWPAARFANDTSPIVIGVLGRNPFGKELENIARDRPVNGRAIRVLVVRTADEVPTVHLLFVPAGEGGRPELAAALAPHLAVLTVGESDQFTARGGAVRFVQQDDKVRFSINLESTDRAGLKLSAQLLKLALAVRRKS